MTHGVPFPKLLWRTAAVELDAEGTDTNPGTLRE